MTSPMHNAVTGQPMVKRVGVYEKLGVTHMSLISFVKRLSITLAAILVSSISQPTHARETNPLSRRSEDPNGLLILTDRGFADSSNCHKKPDRPPIQSDSRNEVVLIARSTVQTPAFSSALTIAKPADPDAAQQGRSPPSSSREPSQPLPSGAAAAAAGASAAVGAIIGGRQILRRGGGRTDGGDTA
eukprot:CAMPEP_0172183578 /NCGR_PEP_ID=MMETSP1050-20130122/19070_1 /TAXON_ID=233186 /ORGANISM="Cryptomonas curvata, Strain CCAP979/52" /LENGTH=186 /DNA_ID=CAMNT_0012857225 /DNA_START=192 /DNA_END=748 /DNA_ORIENTATION=-